MGRRDIIIDLKKQIYEFVQKNDEGLCECCDHLIKCAKKENDTKSIVFAYVWKAYAYEKQDMQHAFFKALQEASKDIDETVPSSLLETYYTLWSQYKQSVSDISLSVLYCLKALDTAEILKDTKRISANLCTLGELYRSFDCYEKALPYLEKALHVLVFQNSQYDQTTVSISTSVFDCYIHLNQLNKAEEILRLLSRCIVDKDSQLSMDQCYMVYYAYTSEKDKALLYADKIRQHTMDEIVQHPDAFSILSSLYQSMMRIQKVAYAKNALVMLQQVKGDKKHPIRLKLALYQLEFDSYYDTEKLDDDYVEYYHAYKAYDIFLEEEKIKALNTKIELHEAHQKQEAMKAKCETGEQQAYKDTLTQLYNRHYFNYKLTQIIHEKTNRNISFLLFDIDCFTEYTILYGEAKSNDVLLRLAHILHENSMEHMEVCRYGRDQFACLCATCDRDTLVSYIDKVRLDIFDMQIEHASSICSDRITLSVGYGMRELPIEGQIFSFIKDVEKTLFHAKKHGRNHVVSLQYEVDAKDDEHTYISKASQVLQLTKDIKAIRFQDLELLKQKCDSLATLAEKNNDLYGLTFSYMYSAHYYQINQHEDAYKFYSEKANELSVQHGFLDMLIEYYKLACIYFTETGDELSSFSSCLQGLIIAMQAYDYEACTAFYNNIADSFYQSGEMDKAEYYYLKALEYTTYASEERPRYKDLVLMNIVNVFVKKKDIEHAKYWLAKSQAYGYDTSLIASYSKRSEICILVLEDKYEEALEEIKKIRKELESEEPMLFIHAYLYLMDILLDMREKEYADWCLHILLSLSKDVNMQFKLQIYAYQIKYCELFNIPDFQAYEIFHKVSISYQESDYEKKCENIGTIIHKHSLERSQGKLLKVDKNEEEFMYIDETTSVYNRDYFERILSKFMYSDTVKVIGIIIVDIDYLKEYNHTYGFSKGDELLQIVANSLLSKLVGNGFVSRFGQDEFACLCMNKNEEEIITFIKEVQAHIKNMRIKHSSHKSNGDKFVTLSFGFYNGSNRDNLLEKAENALLKAKTIGRNTYYPRSVRKDSEIHKLLTDTATKDSFASLVDAYNAVVKQDQTYALVQMNIKNFRYYNTKYGYEQGNEILSLLYDKLLKWKQEGEYVVHMYADMYGMLLKYDGVDASVHDRLVKSIDTIECIKDPRIHRNIFLTFGVYKIIDKNVSFHEAWNAANIVRKETSSPTKRSSSIGVYEDSYKEDYIGRIQLEEDTAEAYKNFEFVPFYQPKVDTRTHEIIGAEALLRWYDDKGNLIPLYKFLPILNENSYINHIDLAIFETTCKMLDERVRAGRPVVPVSFNISKSYFYEDSIVEDYVRVFEQFNISKDLIEIELMETISLDDSERLKKVIQGFKDYGFRCVLDDFGNGYSSFNVLLNNELSAVKIDRQFFVKNLNGDNKLIIKTVVNLIKSLHMKVVAEGVETKEYVDFLADCGCDAIQGYYFYKPMSMKKFCTLINRVK